MFLKVLMCYNVFLFLLMDFLLDQSPEDLKEGLLEFLSGTLPNLFLMFVVDSLLEPLMAPILYPLPLPFCNEFSRAISIHAFRRTTSVKVRASLLRHQNDKKS